MSVVPLAHAPRSSGGLQRPPERIANVRRIQVPGGVVALQEGTRVSNGNGASWTGDVNEAT